MRIEETIARMRPIMSSWRFTPSGFSKESPSAELLLCLPREYLALLQHLGPGEGFIGTEYLRLYPLEDLAAANVAYSITEYLPQHYLFGSDGCGNALLFNLALSPTSVVKTPFIPLNLEFGTLVAADFAAFLDTLASVPPDFAGTLPLSPNPETLGLEVHEPHPVVLGGDPSDLKNKVLLRPPVHAQACVFFNRMVRSIGEQSPAN